MKIFNVDDNILVKHGIEIYDAKILRIDENNNIPHYYIHYQGWNKKWDEWVSIDRVLDTSIESKNLQLNAKINAKNIKKKKRNNNITSSGILKKKKKNIENIFHDTIIKKDNIRDLEQIVQDIEISIPIPMTLKKILIEDWKNITQLEQWIDIPRTPSVQTILNDFLKHEEEQSNDIQRMKSILDGLQHYFDQALSLLLLYRQERIQYDKIKNENIISSSIYGAEHLLRLFVRLPLLLNQIDLDLTQSDQHGIQNILNQLLKFLQKNRQRYFLPNYIACNKFQWNSIEN